MIDKDPKVDKFALILGLDYPSALGIRAMLRFLAEEHYPIGAFGTISNADLADRIDYTGDPDKLVEALLECKILHHDEKGLKMPDWTDEDPSWFGFSRWIRNGNRETVE